MRINTTKILGLFVLLATFIAAGGVQSWGVQLGTSDDVTAQNRQQVRADQPRPRQLGKAEEISGFIRSFDRAENSLVLVNSDDVSYVFILNHDTEILLNLSPTGEDSFAATLYQKATVFFIPRTDGNVALSVEINVW